MPAVELIELENQEEVIIADSNMEMTKYQMKIENNEVKNEPILNNDYTNDTNE